MCRSLYEWGFGLANFPVASTAKMVDAGATALGFITSLDKHTGGVMKRYSIFTYRRLTNNSNQYRFKSRHKVIFSKKYLFSCEFHFTMCGFLFYFESLAILLCCTPFQAAVALNHRLFSSVPNHPCFMPFLCVFLSHLCLPLSSGFTLFVSWNFLFSLTFMRLWFSSLPASLHPLLSYFKCYFC